MTNLVAKKAVDTSTLDEFAIAHSDTADGGVDFESSARVKFHVDDGSSHAAFVFKSLAHDITYDASGTPHGTVSSIDVLTDGTAAYSITRLAFTFDRVLGDLSKDVDTLLTTIFTGKDTITGSKFDDILAGFDGRDTLKGGKGSDVFLFNTDFGRNNVDTIKDFDHHKDSIGIDHALIGAVAGDKVKSASFIVGDKAADKSDHFIYDDKAGKLYFDADGKGHHDQILVAILKDQPTLSAHDLIVF
jgi:hypothetical protein